MADMWRDAEGFGGILEIAAQSLRPLATKLNVNTRQTTIAKRTLMLARIARITLAALTLLTFASPAFAIELDEESKVHPTLGARVGGYGFRHVNDQGVIGWESCRMNGVGFYGTLESPKLRNLFAELSTDLYFATAQPQQEGLDRISLHTLAVGGVRMFPGWLISPNIHVGGGVEYTWVELYGNRDQRVAPVALMGIGGELNIKKLAFGISIRSNLMQLPNYDWQPDSQATTQELDYQTEVAGQMLFSVRYAM